MQIDSLNEFESDIKDRLKTAYQYYIDYHFKIGRSLYKQAQYRASFEHLDKLKFYLKDDAEFIKIYTEVYQKSHVPISITPFVSPYNKADLLKANIETDDIYAEGINITNEFNIRLIEYLNEKKSTFLNFYLDKDENDSLYSIRGRIFYQYEKRSPSYKKTITDYVRYSTIQDNQEVWYTGQFSYDINTVKFVYDVTVVCDVISTRTKKSVYNFTVQDSITHEEEYRTDPIRLPEAYYMIDYPNNYLSMKNEIKFIDHPTYINTLIDNVNANVSDKLLKKLDSEIIFVDKK